METIVKQMLLNAYEIEGLLLLAQERGEDTPENVIAIIKEKVENLMQSADELNDLNSTEIIDNDDDAPNYDHDTEPEEEQPEEPTAEPETTVAPEPEIEEELPVIEEPEVAEEPAPELAETEDEAEPTEEPEMIEIPEDIDDVDIDVDVEIVDDNEEEAINIEDAYIRNKSKDLRSAFSINDTFRFRRELFGNSAADMSDAIDLVIAMNSYDEAEDYFYVDLGWDSESDEVKEFMEIIRNHFI